MRSTILYYKSLEQNSDKEYRVQVTKNGSGYNVQFQYGRRGGTLQAGVKTSEPVSLEEAERIYERLVHEKTSKGYLSVDTGTAPAAPTMLTKTAAASRTPYRQEQLEEIGMEDAALLLKDDRYIVQLKENGHFRQGQKLPDGTIISFNKKGEAKPFPPEVEKELAKLPLKTFFIEGELVGLRYVCWQILEKNGVCLKQLPYRDRLASAVSAVKGTAIEIVVTWEGTKAKQGALALCLKNRVEGVCFKQKDASYRSGESGQHFKLKFLKCCTCRVLELGTKGHDNARLGLLKDGKWIEVGGTSMIGKDKRIRVGSLVEVTFLYFTGSKLYQPRITDLRDDMDESECVFSKQIKPHMYKEGVAA